MNYIDIAKKELIGKKETVKAKQKQKEVLLGDIKELDSGIERLNKEITKQEAVIKFAEEQK